MCCAFFRRPKTRSLGPGLTGPQCRVWAVKIRDVLRLPHEDGWRIVGTRGSHRQLRHARKPGLVTLAGQPNDDLAPGTLKSILGQAGLEGR